MRTRVVIALGALLLLVSSVSAQAQGYCMVSQIYCNSVYFEIGAGGAVQALTGFEYGCSTLGKGRLYSGTLRNLGSTAVVSLTGMWGIDGVNSTTPGGRLKTVNAAISLSTGQSTWAGYMYIYYYTGWGADAYGSSQSYIVGPCAPPAASDPASELKPDDFLAPRR